MAKCTIDPVGHRIVVRIGEARKKQGTIIIPDTAREREKYAGEIGEIVALGPTAGYNFDDKMIKGASGRVAEAGDTIAFNPYAGHNFKDPVTGEEFKILNDEDVLAIIDKE